VTDRYKNSAQNIKVGDLIVVDVDGEGIKYIGEVESLLNFEPDGPRDDKGRRWLKVAKFKHKLIADGSICPLENLARILKPDWAFDADGRRKILAIRQRGACKVTPLTLNEIKEIWPPFNHYLSQSKEANENEVPDFADTGNEPMVPGLSSQEVKKAVERYAVNKAKKDLRQEGFKVESHEKTSPYDLKCMGKTKEYYIEVKGTQNPKETATIFLTTKEVEHARKNKETSKLYIVHSIKVNNEDGKPKARKT